MNIKSNVFVKDKILNLLENNRGRYFSGEEIAKELSVSRTAVWKNIKELRAQGYRIDASTNKGYLLAHDTDIISAQGILKYLCKDILKEDIIIKKSVTSTNEILCDMARNGAKEGTLIISSEQTAGRGRYKRSFFSPYNSGIYMSFLLKPEMLTPTESTKITAMAAVAVCEAIESVCEKKPKIKWVNDIFIENRKVCGILTQASFDMEVGALEYAVLGIGINVYEPKDGFPENIKNIAGYIFSKPCEDVKNKLAAEILNNFFKYYKSENVSYIEKYRNYSFIIGKKIIIKPQTEKTEAKVISIDDECRLVVKYENGDTGVISYGEIQLKI